MEGKATDPELTVCVIGRNENVGIARCGESLAKLGSIGISFETIYVDSASKDGSAEKAERYFDCIAILKDSPHLSASAGRHIGTIMARGRWILFLDGDMELAPDILPHISTLIASRDDSRGLAGLTVNRYPDGIQSMMTIHGNRDAQSASGFGGAVILPRSLLLSAGNWNPRLYSNEEMELYGRLRQSGAQIIWHDVVLAIHHTHRIPKITHLYGLFVPWNSILGKKFYGAGQLVAGSIQNGALGPFLRVRPEPFVYLSLLILSTTALLAAWPRIAAIAFVTALVYAMIRGGRRAPITYLAWLPQVVFGLNKYPAAYAPSVEKRWTKKTGCTESANECIACAPHANGKLPE